MRITLNFTFHPSVTTLYLLMDCIRRMLAIAGCKDIDFTTD